MFHGSHVRKHVCIIAMDRVSFSLDRNAHCMIGVAKGCNIFSKFVSLGHVGRN